MLIVVPLASPPEPDTAWITSGDAATVGEPTGRTAGGALAVRPPPPPPLLPGLVARMVATWAAPKAATAAASGTPSGNPHSARVLLTATAVLMIASATATALLFANAVFAASPNVS